MNFTCFFLLFRNVATRAFKIMYVLHYTSLDSSAWATQSKLPGLILAVEVKKRVD